MRLREDQILHQRHLRERDLTERERERERRIPGRGILLWIYYGSDALVERGISAELKQEQPFLGLFLSCVLDPVLIKQSSTCGTDFLFLRLASHNLVGLDLRD